MLLLTQFLLVNGHFTLNLFAALVTFAVAWLYFDAWVGRRDHREGTKMIGFGLLSLSFLVHATIIEQSLLATPIFGSFASEATVASLRVIAYLTLIFGEILDPIQPLPGYRKGAVRAGAVIAIASIPIDQLVPFLYPTLGVITAYLYLYKATIGLEHHLKTVSWGLYLLAFSDLFSLATTFRGSDNVTIANLVQPFGAFWFAEHIVLFITMFVLGRWVWQYLVKRLETQLLMILTTLTLGIFLATTIFFTTTSLQNVRNSAIANLEINVNVLAYAINSKKAEVLSDAQVIAQNPEVITATAEKDRKVLEEVTGSILLAKKQTYLVITSTTGEILIRADDPEKAGGSLSDDPLVKKALNDEPLSSVVAIDGALAPIVAVRSAFPIKAGGEIVGTVVVGTAIDNAFVDGLKDSTGLDASIYADNIRSATTFIAPDGKSRWIGIREENKDVKKKVLVDGEPFSGSVSILNVPYFSAFSPIKDADNNPIGMLFVGTPQVTLLQAASATIELTFIVTVAMLIISIFPAFLLSRYIISQIR